MRVYSSDENIKFSKYTHRDCSNLEGRFFHFDRCVCVAYVLPIETYNYRCSTTTERSKLLKSEAVPLVSRVRPDGLPLTGAPIY